jgi:hypothetical protein
VVQHFADGTRQRENEARFGGKKAESGQPIQLSRVDAATVELKV